MKIIDNMLNGVSKWACSLMIGRMYFVIAIRPTYNNNYF